MAADQIGLMRALGHGRFHLVGHDRGARAAHRLALDHPAAVVSVTLMDIVPTAVLLTDLRKEVAQSYWHWFFLAQPAPFPEGMIEASPISFMKPASLDGVRRARRISMPNNSQPTGLHGMMPMRLPAAATITARR